jgi:cell wall-associated NlpC family hydrolase
MEWHDLLGTPWRLHESRPGVGGGMDCSTLAETVLRRLGGEPPSTNPFRQRESEGVRNEMGSYFAYLDAAYERLGDSISCATRRGDLVLARDEEGLARHLYVCVEPDRSTFLTTTHNIGVVALRGFAIQRIAGVYRLRDLPEETR